jgi:2-polyprenyl-3-methyl-5-hydroxy-6-metoxy-1,4-benzoquinol methylase
MWERGEEHIMKAHDPTVYDDYASQYARLVEAREAAGIENDAIVARLLAVLGDITGLAVLDAGCGEGYLMIVSLLRP